MAMDLTGASLTTTDIRAITSNIEQISKEIDGTMRNVNSIMTTLTGQSEGGLIRQTTTAVTELHALADTLVMCICHIALKIDSYLGVMLSNDQTAKDTLMKSLESNLYETR